MQDQLIITGASAGFGPSLLAMLGSLDANWPGHPPVIVYDIGLDEPTLSILQRHQIEVRRVPEFCPHWRKHFTWKVWAWNDAPARNVFWIDAGVAVLQPLDEAFAACEKLGYFAVSTHYTLDMTASKGACDGCGVAPEFRHGRMTITGGITAFSKSGKVGAIIEESLRIAMQEESIAATQPLHRHDQAILSLLLHRDCGPLLLGDAAVYAGWLSPKQVHGQKVWNHRRRMSEQDTLALAAHIGRRGAAYLPGIPVPRRAQNLKEVYWNFLHRTNVWRKKLRGDIWIYDGVRA